MEGEEWVEEERSDDDAILEEDLHPPVLGMHGGHTKDTCALEDGTRAGMSFQQRQQQHQQLQSLAVHTGHQAQGVPPPPLEHAAEIPAPEDDRRASCVPRLPSLASPFPGPAPVFNEGMLQSIFAEEGRESLADVRDGRDAGGGAPEKSGMEAEGVEGAAADDDVEKVAERSEGRQKEGAEEKEKKDATGSDILVEKDGELMDLFRDGDIESW